MNTRLRVGLSVGLLVGAKVNDLITSKFTAFNMSIMIGS
jgi:hypothetical protein